MTKRRVGGILTALFVGAIAAIGSFAHQRHLAVVNGQDPTIATLFPLSVDGLIVAGTFALDGANRRWPHVAITLGVVATVSANILSALAPKNLPVAVFVAAFPAISLLLTIEILKPRRAKVDAEDDAKTEAEPTADEPVKAQPAKPNARGATTRKTIERVAAKNPDAPTAVIAAKAGVSESTARRYLTGNPDAELAAITAGGAE